MKKTIDYLLFHHIYTVSQKKRLNFKMV